MMLFVFEDLYFMRILKHKLTCRMKCHDETVSARMTLGLVRGNGTPYQTNRWKYTLERNTTSNHPVHGTTGYKTDHRAILKRALPNTSFQVLLAG